METYGYYRDRHFCRLCHGCGDGSEDETQIRMKRRAWRKERKSYEKSSYMGDHTGNDGRSFHHFCMQLQKMEQKINDPLVKWLIEDMEFRTEMSLYAGFAVNLLYCVMQVMFGIFYHSLWAGALAVFHILLASMRYQLMKKTGSDKGKESLLAEWKKYRYCGLTLLCMTPFFASILILVVHKNGGGRYPGAAIYLMAVYTSCSVFLSAIGLVKFRTYRRPMFLAAKVVCLIKALVSMLSLETAILTRYDSMDNPVFRQGLTGTAGGIVCLFVLVTAVYMTIQGTKQCRILKNSVEKQIE